MMTDKKVCLVTGAAGRLGTAFCSLYSDQYQIVAVYHDRPLALPTHADRFFDPLDSSVQLEDNSRRVFGIKSDLETDAEIERIVDLTLARYDKIDILINAAARHFFLPVLDAGFADCLSTTLTVNTVIPVKLSALIMQKFWKHHSKENKASNRNIVSISSLSGFNVYGGVGLAAYSASKAALNYLTIHMALEFRAFGIRVNAIAPDRFPKSITLEQVAGGIRQLVEDSMTGKILIQEPQGERLI